MKRKYTQFFPCFFTVLYFLVTFFLSWNRQRFGLDVTDISYWVAEPYLVSKGSVPFVNLWVQTPLTSLLLAPLIALITTFSGGTEGIMLKVLHFRVIFSASVCFVVWLLLRKRINAVAAAAFSIALSCAIPFGDGALDYNSVSLYILLLAGSLLFCAMEESDLKKAGLYYLSVGVAMALCAMAHTLEIANCCLFAVAVPFCERRKWKGIPLWSASVLSGLTVALVTIAGLEIAGGGGLFSGIGTILRFHHYFDIPPSPAANILRDAKSNLIQYGGAWLTVFLAVFIASFRFLPYGKTRLRKSLATALPISAFFFLLLCFLLLFRKPGGQLFSDRMSFMKTMPILFLSLPLYPFALKPERRRKAARMLLCFWLPYLLMYLLCCARAAGASFSTRLYILAPGVFLAIPLTDMVIRDNFARENASAPVLGGFSLLLSVLIALYGLSISYHWVYRDSAIPELTYCVQSGTYRGIYTTPERGRAIENLEALIRERTGAGESVLFSDLFPMGYLMTDARICTPSSWDPTMYRYGFQDMNLFSLYFDLRKEIPDKILFVNSEGRTLSVDDPDNLFAAFVRENYTCTLETGPGLFSVRVFETNQLSGR